MLTHPAFARAAPIVASCALHAAVVAGALAFGQFLSPRPPVVLEAVLVAPDPPPAAEPPRPEPRRPEPPRPKPPKAVVPPKPITPPPPPREMVTEPPPTPVAPPPALARPEPAPQPAVAAAPAPSPAPAEPRVSDAPGPRRPSAPVSPGVEAVPAPAPPAAPPPVTARAVPDAPRQPPRPRGGYQIKPSYPSSARRLGIQGTTMLLVLVAADGQVTDVKVDETAGHPDLDRAAIDAVRRWRFEPGRRGAEAIEMWVRQPMKFVLE